MTKDTKKARDLIRKMDTSGILEIEEKVVLEDIRMDILGNGYVSVSEQVVLDLFEYYVKGELVK